MALNHDITESGKASMDAFFSMAEHAFQGFEKLSALNLQVVKTSLTEFAETAQSMLTVQSPQELFTLQTALLQSIPHKAAAYGRQFSEILTAATGEQRAAAEARIADIQSKFLEAINGALRNVPGSGNTVDLMKAAVSAANDAYEGVNRMSRQVGEAVDANITQFTEATAKPARAARTRNEG